LSLFHEKVRHYTRGFTPGGMFLLQLQDTARYTPKNDETTSKKWWWSDLALKRSQPFS
jgi:hypothetical protein